MGRSLSLISALALIAVACGSDEGTNDFQNSPAMSPDLLYAGSSLAEAQERLSFEARIPDPLITPFEIYSATVHRGSAPPTDVTPAGGGPEGSAITVVLDYPSVEGESITIFQTVDDVTTPSASAMQSALLESTDEPTVEALPRPSQNDVMIGQDLVRKTTIYLPDATPVVTYSWNCANTHTDVSAFLVNGLPAADVERLVADLVVSMCAEPDTGQ